MGSDIECELKLPPDLEDAPVGWEFQPLRSLVSEGRGISYGVVQPGSHTERGVPIVRVNNIVSGRLTAADVMRISPEIEDKYRRTRLLGGEVLLTVVGAYFGESAVVPAQFAGWNVARAVAVIPIADDLDPYWVCICLRSPLVQRYMQAWATTTAQPTLNLGDVACLPIPLPPRAEREAIVSILRTLDDKIELNRRMNETLEALAQSLFKSWFVDTAQDGIPDQWIVSRLDGLCGRVLDRVSSPADWAEKPLIDLSRMPQKSIALADWGLGAELTTSVTAFQSKDTLFGAIRPYFHKVGIAPVSGVTSISVFVIRPKRQVDWPFVATLCSLSETVEYANRVSKGTKMPVVSWPDFAAMELVIPSEAERDRFNQLVAPLYERIICNVHESRTLAALRDALLPKLLSGELRVPAAAKLMEAKV